MRTRLGGTMALVLFAAAAEAQQETPTRLRAAIRPASGSDLRGEVTLREVERGVEVTISVQNASPGLHAVHFHEKADCSAPDAKSAGPHFNPTNAPHGLPTERQHHLGDLGNMAVQRDGTGSFHFLVEGATLREGEPRSLRGRALIVHEGHDRAIVQPDGGAGARIGCAEIPR